MVRTVCFALPPQPILKHNTHARSRHVPVLWVDSVSAKAHTLAVPSTLQASEAAREVPCIIAIQTVCGSGTGCKDKRCLGLPSLA